VPVKIHVKKHPETFERFGVQWTPVLLVLDANGKEQHRWEGYLPPGEFLAQLELGVAKARFGAGRWDEAAELFDRLAREHPNTDLAPLAVYYAGVSRYKAGDASALPATAQALRQRFPGSTWTTKSSVWLPEAGAPAHAT
jgi:thioredoxin family protein/tetratricopeptide repeat protein